MATTKRGILERLDAGEIIIGDGGYTYALERRGYMTPGEWTPEVVVEYPEAVTQVHRDFALCGSDLLQAFVFNGTDDNLNYARRKNGRPLLDCEEVNEAGCRLVTEVAKQYNCLVAFPISTTRSHAAKLGKEAVQNEFKRQINAFQKYKNEGSLLLAEYIGTVEEAEWAVEVMKTFGLPVGITMCIGNLGDFDNVSVEEVGVRLVKAGADIIGVNCRFDPDTVVEVVERMKKAVDKAGLKAHYMCQPVAYRTADLGRLGFVEAPECSLAMESRMINRFDAQKYARKAYNAGIRFMGGCCGFEPYHIRAMAEELHKEIGKLPINSRSLDQCTLKDHENPEIQKMRANKEYWHNLVPGDGRKKKTSQEAA